MGAYIEQYLYDAVGNILSMKHAGTDPANPGWRRCYQYALDSNRLLSTSNPNDPHNPVTPCLTQYAAGSVYAEKYTYDAHGNMTTMPHLTLMEWDFKDQLSATSRQTVSETPPPDKVPEATYYIYDAGGQRVRKVWEKAPGLTEERIYLGGFEIFRRHNGPIGANTAKLERETLHVMDDKQRIALVETCTLDTAGDDQAPRQLTRYQLGNHLGSASVELDDQAQIISYEEYYPYGSTSYQAVRNQTETPKRYRYTGKERDEESGFSYHSSRYYAPWIGRWLAADRVSCSPTRFRDPTGMNGDDPLRDLSTHGNVGKWQSQERWLNIAEPMTVGEEDISEADARARALDVNNRELLGKTTNQRTQGRGVPMRPLPPPRTPISVAEDPSALVTRRFSEITEMRAIFDEAVASIQKPTRLKPTDLKGRINAKVWEIIKAGKSPEAARVRAALESIGAEYVPGRGKGYRLRLAPPEPVGPPVDPKTRRVVSTETTPSVEPQVRVSPEGFSPRLGPSVIELDPKPSGAAYGIIVAEGLHDLAQAAHATGEYESWKTTLAKGPGRTLVRFAYETVEGARMTPGLIWRGLVGLATAVSKGDELKYQRMKEQETLPWYMRDYRAACWGPCR
jgi:RHS repeat-associated protein